MTESEPTNEESESENGWCIFLFKRQKNYFPLNLPKNKKNDAKRFKNEGSCRSIGLNSFQTFATLNEKWSWLFLSKKPYCTALPKNKFNRCMFNNNLLGKYV